MTLYRLSKHGIHMSEIGKVIDLQVSIKNLVSMGYVVESSEYNEGVFFAKKIGSNYWEYAIKP